MTKTQLVIAALALGAGLAFAQGKTTVVTGNAQPIKKWESFCADAVSSGVKNMTVEYASDPAGWNGVLKRYGEGGWEPYQMLGDKGVMTGVCFRRQLQ